MGDIVSYDTNTVETELVAAAPITFQKIWAQNLLSKICVLLLGAAVKKGRLLIPFLRYIRKEQFSYLAFENKMDRGQCLFRSMC